MAAGEVAGDVLLGDDVAPNRAASIRALLRAMREAPQLRDGLLVTVLLAMVGTAGQLVVPVVIQQALDGGIAGSDGVDVARIVRDAALAMLALGLSAVASRAAMFRLASATARGLSTLRVKAFRHIHDLSILHLATERRGVLVGRVTTDIDAMAQFMEWGGVSLLIGFGRVVLTLAVMFVYSWQLALVVLGATLVFTLLLQWFQRVLRGAYDQVRERIGETLAVVSEAVSGLPVIRAYGIEARTLAKVDDALDRRADSEFRAWRLANVMFSSAELFAGGLIVAVVWAGLRLGPEAGVSAGILVAFLFLVNLLIDPVQTLVEVLNEAQTAAAGVRRVIEVLDLEPDLADPDDGIALPDGPMSVRLDRVGFRYPTGGDVLRDLDLAIAAGSRVAVVGATGSGKSTFAKLLTRIVDPSSGSVELGGVALDRVAFGSLRDRVAYVPQDGFLFDASLAANLRYGSPGADEEQLRTAIEDLGLTDWVAGLTGGLDARVGERGDRLSAGERQLVALVRAWLAAPDLLVLDEATSAVDPALEVRLRRTIDALTRGRTSITIAHRMSTAQAADEVLVFDAGEIIERGPHDALVAAGGVYADLFADWIRGTH